MNGIRTNGSRITPLAVASGAIASFDAQVAAPLKILKADINPVQEGSGDPSPENVRPISGWDEIKITNESGEIFEAANIVASESEIKAYYDADLVLKPGTYIFSTDATDSVNLIGAQYFSGSWHNIFTQAMGTSRKFTLSRSGKCHFRAELRGSGDLSSNTVSLKQLDEIAIELEGTVYSGVLDVTKGVLSVNKVIKVFNGSETWTLIRTGFYLDNALNVSSNFRTSESSPECLCNMYKEDDAVNISTEVPERNDFSYFNQNQDALRSRLWIKDSRFVNETEFKTYLAQNNLQLVYPIATPVELIIDPISMNTYAGSNKITTDSGNTTACYLKGVTT